MHLLEQLMNSVVRIEAHLSNGTSATGSGFAYNFAIQEDGTHIPAIVTNKHVLEGAESVSLPISTQPEGSPDDKFEIVTYSIDNNVLNHPDDDIDLCAILAGPIHGYFRSKSLNPSLIHLDKSITANSNEIAQLLPLEEVTMIGYPNGIWDSTNNGSIARRGIIATTPADDYLGKKQFVVDMACFPGSSGSPIFLANFGSYADRNGNISMGTRIKLIGILYAGPQHTATGDIVVVPVPTNNRPLATTSIPNNLGYVIKSSELAPLEAMAAKLLSS